MGTEHQLDDFAMVEVSSHELLVRFVFFERDDREVVCTHEWERLGGDGAKRAKGASMVWLKGRSGGEGCNERDKWVGMG